MGFVGLFCLGAIALGDACKQWNDITGPEAPVMHFGHNERELDSGSPNISMVMKFKLLNIYYQYKTQNSPSHRQADQSHDELKNSIATIGGGCSGKNC
jgi:hypothetical protein